METYGISIIYFFYIATSIIMTVWVAKTLHKNGLIFLVDAFHDNQQMADSVNQLLKVGFYLVNLGFILLYLKSDLKPTSFVEGIEHTAGKLGVVLLVLGAMHFFNMFNINKMRKKSKR